MKVHLVTYANLKFKRSQNSCAFSAKLFYTWASSRSYGESDLDEPFVKKYKHILTQSRGGGYWLWKPYLILKRLNEIDDGEWLFYVDSGSVFIKSPIGLFNEAQKVKDQCIFGFGLPLIEKQWTKDEAFDCVGGRSPEFTETNQIMASFILVKKNQESINFFEEYLRVCCQKDVITDAIVRAQCKEFVDHRHDQSVFSLLYKKYGYTVFKDPTQLGLFPSGYSGEAYHCYDTGKLYILDSGRMFRIEEYTNSYNYIIHHVRTENWSLSLAKFFFKVFLLKILNFRTIVR